MTGFYQTGRLIAVIGVKIVQFGEGAVETEAEHDAATVGIAGLLIATIGADAIDLAIGCLNQSGR